MEPQEEYEITVAVEALRDLRSQNNEGLDSSTTDRNYVPTTEKASVPTTEKASVPTTEKASALASVSDHGDVIVPVSSQTVSKDATTTREVSGQAVSDGSGKKRKIVAKNALHNTTKALKGLSLPSNLQTVSLAFPLRDSQKKRILLPKPTASSNVVSIPLSSIISQTIGVSQVVHSKSRDALVSGEDTLHGNREKEMKTKKNRERSFACLRCSTKTTTRQALWKHKRRFHSHEPQEGKTAERVSCDECDAFCCKTLKELLLHYNKAHGKKLRVLCKEFASERDFEEWKKQTEKLCGSWFVLSNGKKVYENHTTRYYYCNKSGFSKGKGIRTSRRAAKIEGKCCAYMRKKQDRNTGQVTVEYSLDHIGHITKLDLSLLPQDISYVITKWHSSGADVDTAVSEIYAKATGLDPATRHLPDSLAYLKQKHTPKDQLERDVLTRMVTELRSRKDNPVLIYKPEGDVEYEMSSEDFIIGIQTQFQRELLKKHANKMICSHVSQGNESFLMTLLVVDKDSNDVIPVCWLLGSVQEDRLFRPFLEALRAKCGNIETDLFVTNLSSALYHVWAETFSKPWRKLDCSWHVDEDWRSNLKIYIPDRENQLIVYAYLKALQYEGDEIHFRKILQEFMAFLGEASSEFKGYFSKNYLQGDRCSHWALCFRKGLSYENHLDGALYEAIRNVMLQSLQYLKPADLLLALLKVSWDISASHFARHPKKGKGHQTAREMKSHHSRSAAIHSDHFTIGDGEWSVSSSSDHSVNFLVRKVPGTCHCKSRCEVCGVCVHMYSCCCFDFLLGYSGCEHIHTIQMANEGGTTLIEDSSSVVVSQEGGETRASLQHVLQNDEGNSEHSLQKEVLRKLKELEKCLKNISEDDILRKIHSQINVALVTAGESLELDQTAVSLIPNVLN